MPRQTKHESYAKDDPGAKGPQWDSYQTSTSESSHDLAYKTKTIQNVKMEELLNTLLVLEE